MSALNKGFKDSSSKNMMDPNLWNRLVWQRAFDKALKEKMAKQYKVSHANQNNSNLRTH